MELKKGALMVSVTVFFFGFTRLGLINKIFMAAITN